ncbi:hypothetical protein JW899_02175 [Candidatus Uhrbacteria bacterium]|nr:hypothetical protein [Candidatus Uhrbacteria bacterium]
MPFSPKLSRSVRCHIRRQKAEIRRKTDKVGEQEKMIADLYAKFGVIIR